jgi:hypothetical protein
VCLRNTSYCSILVDSNPASWVYHTVVTLGIQVIRPGGGWLCGHSLSSGVSAKYHTRQHRSNTYWSPPWTKVDRIAPRLKTGDILAMFGADNEVRTPGDESTRNLTHLETFSEDRKEDFTA